MLKPRTPFLVSVLLGFLGALLAAALKAIFDVTVQDFWKDTATPFLREHVGLWSATMLEWIGPFWSGVGSAFLLMFAVEMVFAWRRSRSRADAPPPVTEPTQAPRALIRFRFTGQMEQPEEIARENIRDWYVYWSPGGAMSTEDGTPLLVVPSSWVVFLVFDRPVSYKQIFAGFTGGRPQAWQARQHLPLSAVVSIDGGMPACEMEVVTRS